MARATTLGRHKRCSLLNPFSSQPQTLQAVKPEKQKSSIVIYLQNWNLFLLLFLTVKDLLAKRNETKFLVAKFPYRAPFPTPNPKAQRFSLPHQSCSQGCVCMCLAFCNYTWALVVTWKALGLASFMKKMAWERGRVAEFNIINPIAQLNLNLR